MCTPTHTSITHSNCGQAPCGNSNIRTWGHDKGPPSGGKALPTRPPRLSAHSEDSGSVRGFLNTVLDGHQSALLLLQTWSSGATPREDASGSAQPSEPLGPAPGTLNSGHTCFSSCFFFFFLLAFPLIFQICSHHRAFALTAPSV